LLEKKSIKKIINSNYFPFIVYGICMLVIHFLAPIPIADDIFFRENPDGIFDWAFFRERYFNWSSRLIIEFFIVLLLKTPLLIWRVLNTGILVLLGMTISQLFVEKNKRLINWFITFLIFLYPLKEMCSAGWVTISLNYLWPLVFGLLSMTVVKRILVRKRISPISYILIGFLLMFSLNQEIMAIALLFVFLASFVYLVINKRFHWFIFLGLVLCIGSLIFTLTTPGNAARSNVEIRWFIDFNHISLLEKLEIGISSTLAQYIFNFNFIFFIFSLLLVIAVFTKYNDVLYRVFALIPLVMSLIFGNGLYVIVDRLFPYLAYIDTEITKYGIITLGNFTKIQSFIPLFLLLLTGLMIVILLYLIFDNTWKSLLALGVLLLGFFSRLILSFSPTIWASGIRTHFLLITAIIICCVMVFNYLIKLKSDRYMKVLLIVSGFIASFSYLNLLMSF